MRRVNFPGASIDRSKDATGVDAGGRSLGTAPGAVLSSLRDAPLGATPLFSWQFFAGGVK
jgi:hypothetical protein